MKPNAYPAGSPPCPTCDTTAPPRRRGHRASEWIGVAVLGIFTCGFGWLLAPATLITSSQLVCPCCDTRRDR